MAETKHFDKALARKIRRLRRDPTLLGEKRMHCVIIRSRRAVRELKKIPGIMTHVVQELGSEGWKIAEAGPIKHFYVEHDELWVVIQVVDEE